MSSLRQTPHLLRYHLILGVLCWLCHPVGYPRIDIVLGWVLYLCWRMLLAVVILSLVQGKRYQQLNLFRVAVPRSCLRAGLPCASAPDGDALNLGDQGGSKEEGPIDERTSAELYDNLKTKEFSDDLYRHLATRKDVEGTQLYTELRKRVDVDVPVRC